MEEAGLIKNVIRTHHHQKAELKNRARVYKLHRVQSKQCLKANLRAGRVANQEVISKELDISSYD